MQADLSSSLPQTQPKPNPGFQGSVDISNPINKQWGLIWAQAHYPQEVNLTQPEPLAHTPSHKLNGSLLFH